MQGETGLHGGGLAPLVPDPRASPRPQRSEVIPIRDSGFTVFELLIVVAVAAVVLGVGFVGGRQVLAGQEGVSSINTLQQSVWQGATLAASRGIPTELHRAGERLEVRAAAPGSNAVLRTFELAGSIDTNLPEGLVLVFTPPGKVDPASLAALPDPLWFKGNGKKHVLTFSLIGEVKVEALP